MSHIRKICEEFGDHFWYPEMQRHVNHVAKNPVAFVELDLKKLYVKRSSTLKSEVSVIVSKIFHHLKMFFSRSYRTAFARSVEVLVYSEKKLNALHVVQRTVKKHFFREKINKLVTERKEREKVNKERLDKALKICRNGMQRYKNRKIQTAFVNLRSQIHQAQSQKNQEADIIHILAQYLDCKETIKSLDDHKPKGFKAIFFGESADSQSTRKNTMERLQNLNQQMQHNAWIGSAFKRKIKDEMDIQKVIDALKEEKNYHARLIQDSDQIIARAKLGIHQLVPA